MGRQGPSWELDKQPILEDKPPKPCCPSARGTPPLPPEPGAGRGQRLLTPPSPVPSAAPLCSPSFLKPHPGGLTLSQTPASLFLSPSHTELLKNGALSLCPFLSPSLPAPGPSSSAEKRCLILGKSSSIGGFCCGRGNQRRAVRRVLVSTYFVLDSEAWDRRHRAIVSLVSCNSCRRCVSRSRFRSRLISAASFARWEAGVSFETRRTPPGQHLVPRMSFSALSTAGSPLQSMSIASSSDSGCFFCLSGK